MSIRKSRSLALSSSTPWLICVMSSLLKHQFSRSQSIHFEPVGQRTAKKKKVSRNTEEEEWILWTVPSQGLTDKIILFNKQDLICQKILVVTHFCKSEYFQPLYLHIYTIFQCPAVPVLLCYYPICNFWWRQTWIDALTTYLLNQTEWHLLNHLRHYCTGTF